MAVSTGTTVLTKIVLDKIEYSTIYTLQEDNSAWFYEAGLQIDADGAYKAYHPDSASGLDRLANAGMPGNWWAIVTDSNGNPVVQDQNDPAPVFYISTTALENTSLPKTDPRRYVDASSIPFIVLPAKKTFGAKLGDLCIVYNSANKKISGAVYADIGPKTKIGEASIATADALGIPSSPRKGGTGNGVVYVVFPNSSKGWPLENADIQEHAMDAFTQWGGLDKLKSLMPDVIV